MQTAPKAFIFDLDGLLLDTEPIYDQEFAVYARLHGVAEKVIQEKLPPARRKMYGLKKEDSARLFLTSVGLVSNPASDAELKTAIQKWLDWRDVNEPDFFLNVAPKPGAQTLVESLAARNFAMAIATSSDQKLWQRKSQNQPWLKQIPIVITSDKVRHGKPAPDIFLAAAQQLNAEPETCIVFEDAVNGIEGALAANMSVVFVPTGTPNEQEISRLKQLYPDFDKRVQILNSLENWVIGN